MPSLGADMESGTVTKWLVAPGDQVQRGDVVAVVDTEKSTIEVEIFDSGVIEQLLVAEGAEVPVGTPLATIGAGAPAAAPLSAGAAAWPAGAAAPVPAVAGRVPVPDVAERPPVPAITAGVAPPVPPPPPVAPRPGFVASPMVRRLASRLGVDASTVKGTGTGGRVTRHDVEAAAAARPPVRPGSRPFIRSSPRARRLATARGLDLAAVTGTGPDGAVTATDVECAPAPPVAGAVPGPPPVTQPPVTQPPVTQPPVTQPPVTGAADHQAAMRRAIGALMARSKREIPHYYLSATADMSAAVRWLTGINADRPPPTRLVMPVLLIRAVARATRAVPEMNGFMVEGIFTPATAAHVGVAVSLRQGGLVAPAIHNADRLSLDELMAALRDLVARARTGRLRSSEMSDPTITVTNLGELGVESVFGVIYPPQVALVGFGRVMDKPWAEAGMLGIRPCTTVTLSADHRASDGHRGGRFLAEIVELLQHPEDL